MNDLTRPAPTKAKTGSFGQSFGDLRVAVAICWDKYPTHLTRQVTLKVGDLAILSAPWSAQSAAATIDKLSAILASCDESVMDGFRRFVGEVAL